MADVTGQVDSYDLTVGIKVSMDEAIYMLSPTDSPLLTGVDSDGLTVLSSAPVDQVEFSWLDEEILTPRSSLSANVVTADTEIAVQANDRVKFSTGDVLIIRKTTGDERIRVTGYSVTTATNLLVSRALTGTATTYATGSLVIGLGTALAEGSAAENARARDRVKGTNCTQIFGPYKVDMTGTQRVISRYGVPDQFSHEVFKRTKEYGIAREQALLYGAYYNSSTTKIRTHGGFDYYITTNHDTADTQLTVLTIQSILQDCYNQGGVPDRVMTNPASLVDLNAVSDTGRVRQEVMDTSRGRRPTMTVYTEFGPLAVVRNRWCSPTDAFYYTREQAKVRVLRPFILEPLAKTADSDQVQMVGEFSFQLKGEEHAAKQTALAY